MEILLTLGATNGQTYGDSRPVIYLAAYPALLLILNSDHIPCGAASGGIWQKQRSWCNLVSSVRLHADFDHWCIGFWIRQSDIVLAGSGEGNFGAGQRAGLYKAPMEARHGLYGVAIHLLDKAF